MRDCRGLVVWESLQTLGRALKQSLGASHIRGRLSFFYHSYIFPGTKTVLFAYTHFSSLSALIYICWHIIVTTVWTMTDNGTN